MLKVRRIIAKPDVPANRKIKACADCGDPVISRRTVCVRCSNKRHNARTKASRKRLS